MWVIKAGITFVLLGIIVQDFKQRSVYALWFPILVLLFCISRLYSAASIRDVLLSTGANLLFLGLQFIMLTAYFSIKARCAVNITTGLLGWGDVLFLASLAFYLPVLSFVAFYLLSLVFALAAWLFWKSASGSSQKQIPLAGLQSLLLVCLLMGAWFGNGFDLSTDKWWMDYLNLWNT